MLLCRMKIFTYVFSPLLGFQDFNTPKQSQDHAFPGALCLKEFTRETKHRLLALEHLQYQLTTQVMKSAPLYC